MNDPLLMRGFEGLRDLFRDGQRLVEWQRAALQPTRERFAANEFEDEELFAVGFVLTVDRADVRMVQRGKELRFTAEPCKAFRIVREALGQDLQRDVASELRVTGAIHLVHAAHAKCRTESRRGRIERRQPRPCGVADELDALIVMCRPVPRQCDSDRRLISRPCLPKGLPRSL